MTPIPCAVRTALLLTQQLCAILALLSVLAAQGTHFASILVLTRGLSVCMIIMLSLIEIISGVSPSCNISNPEPAVNGTPCIGVGIFG